MKRRNAESGKMRRPLKRTKITEGMYGNSMLYLKFVMLWALVVLADYMLEFRFEFLWPFWMMLRSVYDSFKYQGLAFSVFFICIALTSDMICYFFIPLQYIFFAASTYVWVQYVWYTFADKGICVPTVAVCCLVVWVEGAVRGERVGVGVGGAGVGVGAGLCRPLAAHCVGYPAVTLGFGVKSYVGHRLRLRRQRQVREENEFYFQLMRDALPESALEQNQLPAKEPERPEEVRHLNGSVRRRCAKEQNGHCPQDAHELKFKLDKLEKHLTQSAAKSAPSAAHAQSNAHSTQSSAHSNAQSNAHAHSNGAPPGHADEDDKHDHSKGSAKSSKCEKKEASMLKEERRKNKNRDKDKDKESSDSHKSTEQAKEQIVKEVESTKESVKNKECNGYKDGHKEKEKDKERERDKEREKEKEREQRDKEAKESREARESRSSSEEVRRLKAEVAAARSGEADARRALAAAAADRQRRADHLQLKQAHAALQHKVSAWRGSERAAATLERRLGEERRARTHVESQLLRHQQRHARTNSGECESEWCRGRAAATAAAEGEAATLRRDLQRARDTIATLQRDLRHAADQVRSLETRQESGALAGAWGALQERATHLERSLSAETRVKLDLLSALGDAKRHMHIQDGLISRQEKEIEELKAQLLAVMPAELAPSLRLSAALDPNASVYTPKQLCSDA